MATIPTTEDVAIRTSVDPTLVGYRVEQGPWSGAVVSVHSRAINIARSDGVLVSIVGSLTSMTCYAMLVEDDRGLELLKGRMNSGTKVECIGRSVVIGSVVLDLRGAALYAGTVQSTRRCQRRPSRQPALRSLAATLRDVLEQHAAEGSLFAAITPGPSGTVFSRRVAEIVRQAAGRRRKSLPSCAPGPGTLRPQMRLERLVGLGIGFTPAGDDFVAGALFGMRMAGQAYAGRAVPAGGRGLLCCRRRSNTGGRRPPSIVGDRIERRLGATSPGGRALLSGALHGSFPGYLIAIARQCAARSAAALEASIREALAQGETSGSDACAGLLWYLELVTSGRSCGHTTGRKAS